MDIPIEIRLSILDYLLPRNHDNSRTVTLPTRACEIDHDAQTNTIVLGIPRLDPHPVLAVDTSPSRFALRRYLFGIGLVSHQLHAESNKVLHSATFIVDISEQTFTKQGCHAFRFIYYPTVWEWNPLLPGLDLSHVRELKVRLRPSDHCMFWEYMHDCMRAFCESLNQRIDGGGLKRLTIEITETESTGGFQPLASLLPASANDFAGILDSFRRYLGNVHECSIMLPKWATEDRELMELVEETKTTVCLPWETTGFEQTVGGIQVEEAASKKTQLQDAECDTTQGQEQALEDTQDPPTDNKWQQSLEWSHEWSLLKEKELFQKQKHDEWDDWYESGDCSCYECPHISEGRWSVSEDGLGG